MGTEAARSSTALATTQPGAALASMRDILISWVPAHEVTTPKAAIERALLDVNQMLRPIAPKVLATLLDQTLSLWPTPENWAQIGRYYTEALADAPFDLVDKALKHVRLHRQYATMPKPAELRQPIEADLARRQSERTKLLLMRERAPDERRDDPVTPEQWAHVQEILAKVARERQMDRRAEQPISPRYIKFTEEDRERAFRNLQRSRPGQFG